METENTKKTSVRHPGLLVLVIIFILIIIYYSVMLMLGPSRKMAELKKEYATGLTEKKGADNKILYDSSYLRLLKERAFIQSKVIMAETDSIYLTIDMTDSTVNLGISGVIVHTAKMSSFKTSRILTRGDENIVGAILATPLTISSSFATIKKEPVMIKMAPKDTSEYKPDIMPDTSVTEPVNYILKMNDGIRIYVYQDDNEKRADRISQFKFDLTDRLRQAYKALKQIALFKVPEYHPFIKIKLPRAEAKIIYRAIPGKGQIAVYL